jgi:hypothetical protein
LSRFTFQVWKYSWLTGPSSVTYGSVELGLALLRQVAARRDQRRAGAVLEAAVAVVDRVQHEHVALERRLLAVVPERDGGSQMRCVSAIRRSPSKSGSAPATTSSCGTPWALKRPRQKRPSRPDVDQLVVVGRLAGAAALRVDLQRRHRAGDLPVARQALDLQAVRLVLAPFDTQRHAGAVEEAAPRVQESGAHRGVEGVPPRK